MTEEELYLAIRKFQKHFALKNGDVEYVEDYDIVLWIDEYFNGDDEE